MRTKTEIKEEIRKLQEWRGKPLIGETPEAKARKKIGVRVAVLALRFALGYKRSDLYWCAGCGILHKGVRCPKCGSDNVLDK